MKVLKFGGTSMGSAERIKNVAQIINDGEAKVIVLSAMSGTTNDLVQLSNFISLKKEDEAYFLISTMLDKYKTTVSDLFGESGSKYAIVSEYVLRTFDRLRELVVEKFTTQVEKEILSKGELLSTHLFYYYNVQIGRNTHIISALSFMRINENEEPDYFYIKQNLEKEIEQNPAEFYITQGFICLNQTGEIDNLKRGGSDYTASLVGAALKAENIQIWTDIDGFHNNDPRVVSHTLSIEQLSFDEAAELAYFGAKILHPLTITPAKKENIPVWLKNTMEPQAKGTIIENRAKEDGIKAVAAKDGITALKIKSARMLLAHGFLKKVFDVFSDFETAIDMITTSEIAISLTIDDTKNLEEIVSKLNEFAEVEVDYNQTIVCVVGQNIVHDRQAKEIFSLLSDIEIRMISYGGSKNNISLLVDQNSKLKALEKINEVVFSLV